MELKEAIKKAEAKHYVIFHYKRKKLVRINGGGKLYTEKEALNYIINNLI